MGKVNDIIIMLSQLQYKKIDTPTSVVKGID